MGIFTLANIESVVTILGGIATAVSAYLGLQALTEVRRQRESSYKPEIVLSGGEYYIYNLPLTQLPFPPAIPWEYVYEDKGLAYHATNRSKIVPLPIHLYNIGLGAAKNVTVKCETDIDAWLNIFTEMSKRVEGELPFVVTYTLNNTLLSCRSADFVGVGSRSIGIGKIAKVFNHILPSSIDSKPKDFVLPLEIFYFMTMFTYIDAYTQNSKKPYYARGPLPIINFVVEYLDIADKKIEKRFSARFKSGGYSVALISGMTGVLEVEEVTIS